MRSGSVRGILVIGAVSICVTSASAVENTGPWNVNDLKQTPEATWAEVKDDVQEVFYVGEPFEGHATRVFAHKDDDAAVDFAVVGRHGGRRRRTLLFTRAGHPLDGVTPNPAKERRGVLPAGQCQHDRKKGCSKHVTTRDNEGQILGQLSLGRRLETQALSVGAMG